MTEPNRVAIVTDSTSDLPPDLQQEYGITVVPLNIHFGDETFKDQVGISTDQFIQRLATADPLPTTSQPAVGLFEEAFRNLAQSHDQIVCITLSEKLSGTMQSAQIAANSVADLIPVEVIDSRNVSYGLGFQVLRAVDLAREGKNAEEIAAAIRAEVDLYELVFFVETLEFLRRGGRIGKANQLLGSLLKIKPLLRVDEGQVVPHERTRTRSKAMAALVDFVKELPGVARLAVIHNTTPEDAQTLASTLSALYPDLEIPVIKFGPVIATHTGPGIVGVAVKERGQ